MVVGMLILFRQARAYVDFSLRRLFVVPTLALVAGLVSALALLAITGIEGSDWLTGAVKIAVFSSIFLGIVLLVERHDIPRFLSLLRQLMPEQGHQPPS